MEPRLLIISPVRNEATHLERVAAALARQDVLPSRWIVVDDHSTDETPAILRRLASELPFLTVVRPPEVAPAAARDRLALAVAPRAFNVGWNAAAGEHYTHVMKLDGDIELPPHYLRVLMDRFADDPDLGLAGGVLDEPLRGGGFRRIRIARQHVHGAVKCYSSACFERIGGVQERLGWDTIDETYARMHGFRTVSFTDLVAIHHRPIGSADGTLRGHARHGECAYITHYPVDFAALRSFKVGCRRPAVLSGLAFFFGYLRAAVRQVERVPDAEYRRFARKELRARTTRGLLSEIRTLTQPKALHGGAVAER